MALYLRQWTVGAVRESQVCDLRPESGSHNACVVA